MVFLKENLIECIETVKPTAFRLEYHTGVIYLDELVSPIEKRIGITFSDYFPHSVTFTGIVCSLTFETVEKILSKESLRMGFNYSSASSFQSTEINLSKYSVVDKKIESSEEFKEIKTLFDFAINKIALPFFERYEDLSNVAELLSGLQPKEVVPYIQGPKLFCKTILILREAKHPKYEEKRDEFYEVLKRQATKKEVYAQQLQLFELLFMKAS